MTRFIQLFIMCLISFAVGCGIMDMMIQLWFGITFLSLFPFILCLSLAAICFCFEYYVKGK